MGLWIHLRNYFSYEGYLKIRKMLGVNRTRFSKYMDIPLRTLEEWEAGRIKMPAYVLRLIVYYVKTQKVLCEKGIDLEEEFEQK